MSHEAKQDEGTTMSKPEQADDHIWNGPQFIIIPFSERFWDWKREIMGAVGALLRAIFSFPKRKQAIFPVHQVTRWAVCRPSNEDQTESK